MFKTYFTNGNTAHDNEWYAIRATRYAHILQIWWIFPVQNKDRQSDGPF